MKPHCLFVIGSGRGVHVFFFQAEDGIRYPLVTGVQTCALPILSGIKGGKPASSERWMVAFRGKKRRSLPKLLLRQSIRWRPSTNAPPGLASIAWLLRPDRKSVV